MRAADRRQDDEQSLCPRTRPNRRLLPSLRRHGRAGRREALAVYLTAPRRPARRARQLLPLAALPGGVLRRLRADHPGGRSSQAVYPKDPAAPLCACFGLTRAEIEQDVREGVVTRTKAALGKANSPQARCSERAANGRPARPTCRSIICNAAANWKGK